MKTNSDLHLPDNPTLADFQQYVIDLEEARGFTGQSILQRCLMLGEEVGELFKSIRKSSGFEVDKNSKFGSISEELADCFIFLCSIANEYGIDLEEAFREKEEVNKKRTWKKVK